jgi:hypothetical protein
VSQTFSDPGTTIALKGIYNEEEEGKEEEVAEEKKSIKRREG